MLLSSKEYKDFCGEDKYILMVSPSGSARLEIYSLGQFTVVRGDLKLSDGARRSSKLWALLAYLLANSGKGASPHEICEVLWPGREDDRFEHALRTLVYRLRKILGDHDPAEANHIAFSGGYYAWDTGLAYRFDAEEFEKLCRSGGRLVEDEPRKAAALFGEAISLYRGDFLPQFPYDEWVAPLRNHYRRMYVETVLEQARLCRQEQCYFDMVRILEQACLIEPFEESLHRCLIEGLLREQRFREAQTHYEYITSLFYREMGVKPSAEMLALYRQIKVREEGVEMDLSLVVEGLREREENRGALLCSPDIMRTLFKLEERRLARTGQAVFLALLTITNHNYGFPARKTLAEAMDLLQELLVKSLRRGDVISRWNEAQFLVMLPGLHDQQAEAVLARIFRDFKLRNPHEDIVIRSKLQPCRPS